MGECKTVNCTVKHLYKYRPFTICLWFQLPAGPTNCSSLFRSLTLFPVSLSMSLSKQQNKRQKLSLLHESLCAAPLTAVHPAHHFNLFPSHVACSHLCRYSLEWDPESDSIFDIDTVEGTISTNEYLDRETAVQHKINVVATKVSKYHTTCSF